MRSRSAAQPPASVDVNPAINGFTRSLGFQVYDGELADAPADPVDAVVIWNAFDQMVALQAGEIVRVPLEAAVGELKTVDPDLFHGVAEWFFR